MDAPTAPQRVIANAEYPYGDQVERARELLTRMGIADVKPLYAPRMPVANDTATPGRRSHLNRLIQTARLERLAG
jgi:hypothetical protein